MTPAERGKTPDIQFSSVVLPAPLGPMTPTISPFSTSKETSRRAGSPPKFFDTPEISKIATLCILYSFFVLYSLVKNPARSKNLRLSKPAPARGTDSAPKHVIQTVDLY
jgi:hypothetical protein